jgi:hypothetical protein
MARCCKVRQPGYFHLNAVFLLLKLRVCVLFLQLFHSLRLWKCALRSGLLAPLLRALCALVKRRHGLVGTADLQLVPVGLVVAALFVGALH